MTSWRRLLANGLLALALIVAHSLPMPATANAVALEQHHAAMADGEGANQHGHHAGHDTHKPLPGNAACQTCPGMAIFLPEPMRQPIRMAVSSFDLPEQQTRRGISPMLDTPPPKTQSIV